MLQSQGISNTRNSAARKPHLETLKMAGTKSTARRKSSTKDVMLGSARKTAQIRTTKYGDCRRSVETFKKTFVVDDLALIAKNGVRSSKQRFEKSGRGSRSPLKRLRRTKTDGGVLRLPQKSEGDEDVENHGQYSTPPSSPASSNSFCTSRLNHTDDDGSEKKKNIVEPITSTFDIDDLHQMHDDDLHTPRQMNKFLWDGLCALDEGDNLHARFEVYQEMVEKRLDSKTALI